MKRQFPSSDAQPQTSSRREFLKWSGTAAATTALAGVAVPHVHAAEDNTIRLALIGCGGRGSGAAANALSTKSGPIKLVAMADIFESRLSTSYQHLKKQFAEQVNVPDERKFIGFDAYKKAMDCLKPGDVAIFATYPAFRWVHFGYAIEKGIHVFMEKPVTVDGPTTRKMLKLAEESAKKNLKVGVGLMSRHSRALQELAQRVHGGQIGDIILMRGYRVTKPVSTAFSEPKPDGISELLWQIKRSVSFLWASGGLFSDFNIHIIDHLCWMKNAWPVEAQALGGRHYRQSPEGVTYVDQNFDVYGVEYTFADGTKFNFDGRCMNGCATIYSSYIHGTKGSAIVSKQNDCGLPSSIFKGQAPNAADLLWQPKLNPDEQNPQSRSSQYGLNAYQNEWDDLIDAIRHDKPYNEVQRGAIASLVTSMGRMAAHTGQIITYDEILNHDHEFAPDVDKLTMDSPAPLRAGSDGKYPVPMPGITRKREY